MKMVKDAIADILKQHPELIAPLQEIEQRRGGLDSSQTLEALIALRDKKQPAEIDEILDMF